MADDRFFHRQGPFTIQHLADLTGSTVSGSGDADVAAAIQDVAPLDSAEAGQLSFLDNRKYLDQFKQTKAAACFVAPDMAKHAPKGMVVLVNAQPYKAYALAAQAFYPQGNPSSEETVIEDGAIVHDTAQLGAGCWIESGAVIGAHVVLGKGCRVGANAVVTHALIGDYVHIYRGAMIGQDGFGFAIDTAGYVKVPQLGRVVIGDYVEIGANTTIDRGSGPDTVIGAGTWIDNLVQIAHNVRIGRGCIFAAQVGIAGSTVIDDYVMIGGQAGISGHLHIGARARLAAQSGVIRDLDGGQEYMGTPALPMKQFMRQVATLKRLIKPSK